MKLRFAGRRFMAMVAIAAGLIMPGMSPAEASNAAMPTPLQVSSVITTINPRLPSALRNIYAVQTLEAAEQAQIDPCLLIAIVSVESHWNASAVSPHGAIGLGQLMAPTAASLHANPYVPSDNLRATSQYLRLLLDQFAGPSQDVTAIAAYNAGPGAVARNHNAPPNTSTSMYVQKVLAVLAQTRSIIGQSAGSDQFAQPVQTPESQTVNTWFNPFQYIRNHDHPIAAPVSIAAPLDSPDNDNS